MALVPPVIVVPGITANYLDDRYALPPETVWSVLTKEYERAALHPDKLQYEAIEPALVRPGQLFEIAYSEIIEELRFNLRERQDQPVPVYPFSYDWRQPLETAARELGVFIDEVIARTALLRHYHDAGYEDDAPKVNLIGHSMGGLVIATYLDQARRNAKVERVVSLATPFHGSFESIVKIATGVAGLGNSAPSSREREAARVTPALYYLIPDIPDAVDIGDPAIPKDLFDPAAWQPSIVDTISEYIRLHGLVPGAAGPRRVRAQKLFGDMLAAAQSGRGRTSAFKLPMAGLTEDRWLSIVGVDSETRVRLAIKKSGRAPEFDFQDEHLQNRWSDPDPALHMQTGDGTVPLAGALPSFLPRERIVAVKPSDFDRMEIADRILASTAGFHGILPKMNMLHRLIVRFFKNGTDARKNTWGRPVPGVSVSDWNPPLRGGLSLED
jgi:pimeloyl-ACP methyl ester carboxylesterase